MPIKSWMQFLFVVIIIGYFIAGLVADRKANLSRTYLHAVVGDIIMSYGYHCDFGVLYNTKGVPMIDVDGYPIECYEIELKKRLYKTTINPEPLEQIESKRGEPRG